MIAPVGDVPDYKENNKVFLQGVVMGSFNALTVAVAGSSLDRLCTDSNKRWKFDQRLDCTEG